MRRPGPRKGYPDADRQGIVEDWDGEQKPSMTRAPACMARAPKGRDGAGIRRSGALAQRLYLGGAIDHRLQGGADHVAADGYPAGAGPVDAQQHVGGGAGLGAGA